MAEKNTEAVTVHVLRDVSATLSMFCTLRRTVHHDASQSLQSTVKENKAVSVHLSLSSLH